jgi:hypothetical protein
MASVTNLLKIFQIFSTGSSSCLKQGLLSNVNIITSARPYGVVTLTCRLQVVANSISAEIFFLGTMSAEIFVQIASSVQNRPGQQEHNPANLAWTRTLYRADVPSFSPVMSGSFICCLYSLSPDYPRCRLILSFYCTMTTPP